MLASTTLLCLLLAIPAATVPVDMSFLSVLNQDDPLVARYLAMNEAVGLSHRALLLLEGPGAEGAAARAEEVLTDHPEVEWAMTDPRTAPSARLVVASLREDPMLLAAADIAAGRTAFSQVADAVDEALADSTAERGWAGVPPQTIEDIESTLGRFTILSPLSILLVLLLLRLVERRPLRILLIGAPMLLAVVGTFGVSALVFGDLSFNEGFFGVVVCGLGADFALHLLVRLRERRAEGAGFDDALQEALVGAGPAIVAGAVTTIGAFSVLALAPETLPRRIGVAGAAGLGLCLILMLTWLPAAWVLWDRRDGAEPPPALRVPGIARLAGAAVARPGLTVVLLLAVLVAAAAGVPRLRYETDFARIANRDVTAHQVSDRIQELFGATATPWVVASDTLPEARAVADAFAADPLFVRVDGAATVLPVGVDDLPPDTPPGIAANLRARDGRWLSWASTDYTGLQTDRLRAEREAAEAIAPDVAGYGLFVEAIVAPDRPWSKGIGLGIFGVVLLVLMVDLRSPRWMLLALAPPAVGMAATLGVLAWADVGLGIVHVISIPLLLGLGVDDGLHVVHRLREDPSMAADAAAVSVGRPIVITTATTCAGFGAMALSNNPSLESTAFVVLIGLPICLLASVTLVPAMAVLLRLR